MLGKYVRGFRHLKRCVANEKVKKLFIFRNNRPIQCEAFVGKKENCHKIFIFQRIGCFNDSIRFNQEEKELAERLLSKYGYCFSVMNHDQLNQLGSKVFIVDDEKFDEHYELFRNNNKKLLGQVYDRYCHYYEAVPIFMFALIGDCPNLYVWALKNYHNNCISLNVIESIIRWQQKYSQLVKKLSKGTITAYNGNDNINKLINEIVQLRQVKRANDSINIFNTKQKKILKQLELDDKKITILNRFGRLSNQKKHNFVRKMSTIEDVNEIMRQMAFLSNIHFEWNKDSLLEYINNTENIDCEIVLNDKYLVLVKVKTYDTIKSLAKTTNWCISKNKRYWDDYVGFHDEANQFVLFDFSKPEDHELSIIGFTTKKQLGITNAHSYSNNNLIHYSSIRNAKLKSFLDSKDVVDIYSIIKGHNIPLSNILNVKLKHYEWNFNSFVKFLNFCLSENDYNIHLWDEKKGVIILSTKHENVKFLIGDVFNVGFLDGNHEYFLFLDFSCDIDERNRLLYAVITMDKRKQEEFCEFIFDAFGQENQSSFEILLEKYDLPYDIICRTNDKFERFFNAFVNYDIPICKTLINDKEILTRIKCDKKSNFKLSAFNALYETIFQYTSFDYINLIYDNGHKIVDFIGEKNLKELVSCLINELSYNFRHIGKIPQGKTFNEMSEGFTSNMNKCWVGQYYIFKLIMEHEKSNIVLNKLIEIFPNIIHHNLLDEVFLTYILNKINFTTLNKTTERYLKHIASINSEKINKILLEKEMCLDCETLWLSKICISTPYYSHFKTRNNLAETNSLT